MQQLVPVPEDLQPWLAAAVVVRAPAALAQSQFPAMVSSMLVVRLAGQVACRGAPVPPSAWISASTLPTVYRHDGPVHAVGLVLQPGAAAALWAGARGKVNTLQPLAELAGPGWTGVDRAVRAAADDTARLQRLCACVRQWVAEPSLCDARRLQGLALLLKAGERARDAAHRMDLSPRQWERRFAAHWGMAYKQFEVIARMNGALGQAVAGGPASASAPAGADLALEQGYYDQSHRGRDVRRLAGLPLQALVDGAGSALSAHWPLQVGARAPHTPAAQALRTPR